MPTSRFLAAALAAASAVSPAAANTLGGDGSLAGYIQGRHAAATGELDRAANYFIGAAELSDNDPLLLRRLLDTAVAAGDFDLAMGAAQRLEAQGEYDTAIGTLEFVHQVRTKRWDAARAAADKLSEGGFGNFVAPILKAWVAQGERKKAEALALVSGPADDTQPQGYFDITRAQLQMLQGKDRDAIQSLMGQIAEDDGQDWRSRLLLADAYQAAGRADYAAEVLDNAVPAPDVIAARAQLAAGETLDEAPHSASEGLSRLFLRLAADISRNRPVPMSLVFTRAATWLDAGNDRAWLATGQYLAQAEQYDAALEAARQVKPGSVLSGLADAQVAGILIATERNKEALEKLEAAAHAPGADAESWANLGQAYHDAKRYGEAIDAYRKAQSLQISTDAMAWQLWFMTGAAEEAQGDWEAAEVAFRKALEIAPKESLTLNYLGYTLLDRGQKVDEAIKLIEQAHALAPENGHITDSLGWAQYRQGDYAAAVETLEKAINSVPGDTTVNDHLGDAYWQVGRRIEARFRWRAALQGEPTDEQEAAITRKLSLGLDRALAMGGDAPARP